MPAIAGRGTLDRRRGALIACGLVAAVAMVVTFVTGSPRSSGEGDYAWLMTVYGIAAYTSVGVVILWQRPGHGIGRLTLASGLAFAIGVFAEWTATAVGPLLAGRGPVAATRVIVGELSALVELIPPVTIFIGGVLLIAWFPDGRPAGRAGRGATLLASLIGFVICAFALLQPLVPVAVAEAPLGATEQLATLALVIAYIIAVLDLAARYRRADPVPRAQIRWVVAAAGVGAVLTSLIVLASLGVPVDFPGLWDLWILSLLLPVLAIGIAITRYHLYDIDRIVSRSIAYLAITAVLFSVFALVNLVVTQALSTFLPTEARTVGVALSTLIVATLFQPLRRRVQLAIDRRFHRSRYDAQQTVDGFSARLGGQVDLIGLGRELQVAAVDTVEPSSMSVWLRPSAR